MNAEGFSGREAADIVGITYRQLDYWARTDLIRPSLADAKGSGSRGASTPTATCVELKMIKTLLDAGPEARAGAGRLRVPAETSATTSAAVQLVIAGETVMLVRDDELIDVVNKHRGQGVLNFLALEGVVEQVDAGDPRAAAARRRARAHDRPGDRRPVGSPR